MEASVDRDGAVASRQGEQVTPAPFNPTYNTMKRDDTSNVTKAEEIFLGVLAAVVLLLLPMLGAEAMLLGAGAGLIAYTFFFRERIRRRGWLMAVIPIALALALGAAIAVALNGGK